MVKRYSHEPDDRRLLIYTCWLILAGILAMSIGVMIVTIRVWIP